MSTTTPQANDTLVQYFSQRRSAPAKELGEPGPTEAELRQILEIAHRTPDHGKLGPWRFVVIEGEARARFGEQLALRRRGMDRVEEERARITAGAHRLQQDDSGERILLTPHVRNHRTVFIHRQQGQRFLGRIDSVDRDVPILQETCLRNIVLRVVVYPEDPADGVRRLAVTHGDRPVGTTLVREPRVSKCECRKTRRGHRKNDRAQQAPASRYPHRHRGGGDFLHLGRQPISEAMNRLECVSVRPQHLPQAADGLGKRVVADDSTGPAGLEQAVFRDFLAGVLNQNGEKSATDAIELHRLSGDDQITLRAAELDSAKKPLTAHHTAPRGHE